MYDKYKLLNNNTFPINNFIDLKTINSYDLLQRIKNQRFRGITSPYVYMANAGTVFAYHREDCGLLAANHLISPYGLKIWYCIHPKYYEKV